MTLATTFTPIASTLGGVLIGAAAAVLMYFNGRIAGVSGIAGDLIGSGLDGGDGAWRRWFLAGLLAGGAAWSRVDPGSIGASGAPLGRLVVAGLLVGVGTQLANGCTSGHGVCGLARLSPRSFAAVVTFVGAAAVAVLVSGGAA